jgi:hypothetical protein
MRRSLCSVKTSTYDLVWYDLHSFNISTPVIKPYLAACPITRITATVLILASSLWLQPAAAQGIFGEGGSKDRWESSLFVYRWMVRMDGTVGIAPIQQPVDMSFGD